MTYRTCLLLKAAAIKPSRVPLLTGLAGLAGVGIGHGIHKNYAWHKRRRDRRANINRLKQEERQWQEKVRPGRIAAEKAGRIDEWEAQTRRDILNARWKRKNLPIRELSQEEFDRGHAKAVREGRMSKKVTKIHMYPKTWSMPPSEMNKQGYERSNNMLTKSANVASDAKKLNEVMLKAHKSGKTGETDVPYDRAMLKRHIRQAIWNPAEPYPFDRPPWAGGLRGLPLLGPKAQKDIAYEMTIAEIAAKRNPGLIEKLKAEAGLQKKADYSIFFEDHNTFLDHSRKE